MEEYQKRVVDEKKELDEKIVRLQKFTRDRAENDKLPAIVEGQLLTQVMIMLAYSAVLACRIALFEE